jgi:hypothetical protein
MDKKVEKYRIVLYSGEYLEGEIEVFKEVRCIDLYDSKENKHYMIPFRDIWYYYRIE